MRNFAFRRLDAAHEDILAHIANVAVVTPRMTEVSLQGRLQRQYFADKPSVDLRHGVLRLATMIAAFAAVLWCLCHPPPASISRGLVVHPLSKTIQLERCM